MKEREYFAPLPTIEDPNNLPQGCEFITSINDELNYPDRTQAFYRQGNYLTVAHYWIAKPRVGEPFLTIDQFDAPLAILPWFVNQLEFFRKPSFEGGLPANKIATDKEKVGGEYIFLSRAMDAGNARRDGGYSLHFLNRESHDITQDYQYVTFSDSFLFEGGLLDVWKDLAQRYELGLL